MNLLRSEFGISVRTFGFSGDPTSLGMVAQAVDLRGRMVTTPEVGNTPVEFDHSTKSLKAPEVELDVTGVLFIHLKQLTLCIITTRSGFEVVGESGTIDPDAYDEEVGRKWAYKKALSQLWALTAYAKQREVALASGLCACRQVKTNSDDE